MGTAYLVALGAIDEYFPKTGLKRKELPKSVDAYRDALKKLLSIYNYKLTKEFFYVKIRGGGRIMLQRREVASVAIRLIAIVVGTFTIFMGGCATTLVEPDPDAYYGPYPEHYKRIALEHFVLHKGPYFKVEERIQWVPTIGLSFTPKKGCEVNANGDKVCGWKVSMPLYRYRYVGGGMAELRKTWGTVIIRDGEVVWCDCER